MGKRRRPKSPPDPVLRPHVFGEAAKLQGRSGAPEVPIKRSPITRPDRNAGARARAAQAKADKRKGKRRLQLGIADKAIDAHLDRERERRRKLIEDAVEESRRDPRFLKALTNALKPLRKRGLTARPASHGSWVRVIAKSPVLKPGEAVAMIAEFLVCSTAQARRLYDQARKRL